MTRRQRIAWIAAGVIGMALWVLPGVPEAVASAHMVVYIALAAVLLVVSGRRRRRRL